MLGIAKSTIYRLVKEDKFPRQIRLTERTSVWRLSVINKWIAEKENSRKWLSIDSLAQFWHTDTQ